MSDINLEIFSGKSFSSLLQDIYKNSSEKKKQIHTLIEQLRPLVTSATEAAVIVPMIAEYLDVAVKNDEQLVKMAGIVQRLITSDSSSNQDTGLLTSNEREELLKRAESEVLQLKETQKQLDKPIEEKVKDVLEE